MKKKLLAVMMVAAMTVATLAGCGKSSDGAASASADSEDVIKIGVFEPLTGENGGGGSQEVDGIKYANQVYPEVLGKKIELVVVDNKSDKGEATTAATRLVEQEGVVAVLGSYGSGVSIAAGDIFKNAKVPAMGCSCTNPMVTQGNEYYFRTCFLDPFQGTVMANYCTQQGFTKAAVVYQNGDDYSTGLANFFKTAFTEAGGEMVNEGVIQTNDSDYNSILTNIKSSGAEVIFAPSSIQVAGAFIKQARALGIDALICAGDTWENEAIIDVAGEAANGIVLSTFYDENDASASDEAKKFVPGFKEYLGGDDNIIPAVSALGYDAYCVVRDAIERAGSTDGDAIRQALVDTKEFVGVTGAIKFDENGDADKSVAIVKTVENGEFKYLDTVEVAK